MICNEDDKRTYWPLTSLATRSLASRRRTLRRTTGGWNQVIFSIFHLLIDEKNQNQFVNQLYDGPWYSSLLEASCCAESDLPWMRIGRIWRVFRILLVELLFLRSCDSYCEMVRISQPKLKLFASLSLHSLEEGVLTLAVFLAHFVWDCVQCLHVESLWMQANFMNVFERSLLFMPKECEKSERMLENDTSNSFLLPFNVRFLMVYSSSVSASFTTSLSFVPVILSKKWLSDCWTLKDKN